MLKQTLCSRPQPATRIQVDNECLLGILINSFKQEQSKAMDMRFYWVKYRIMQGQFYIYWRRGRDNLADYFTKYHSPAHHKLMRSTYLINSVYCLQGKWSRFVARVC